MSSKGNRGVGGEIQISKSPAEFFAENQSIAGFDNLGKSLYTTLRELMENALDAAECIGELPDINVTIEELTLDEFNELQGLDCVNNKKENTVSKSLRRRSGGDNHTPGRGSDKKSDNELNQTPDNSKSSLNSPGTATGNATSSPKKKKSSQQAAYFRIQVRDNGCGMAHDAIPNLLGRVLSGSKYGVRQTRGKFGLGAKMALIWSKKSTGLPIHVVTSHRPRGGPPAPYLSECRLDIDISQNCPRVLEHIKRANSQGWIGSQFEILIAGNWTTYKSRILHYLLQLAIITPYAKLQLQYSNQSDPKRNLTLRYDRRSEQMPPPAREVKHHPASVNNLLVQQLLQNTKCKTLVKFLSAELASVSLALAKRLVAELGDSWDEAMPPSQLTDRQITRLVQLLRSYPSFKAPDGSCLSPLGEYNLNLGIRKVLEPDVIATARDKPSAHEGHPFVVEAAVSLGGSGSGGNNKNNGGGEAKQGITVFRFANRIPLLFEAGADVVTRVALSKIRWSNYKMDQKRDKIGVFVSIVSTKIPFKGTGKEYIGDDIMEIQRSVRRALQHCCQQLRTHLTKRNALRDSKERRSKLTKYVPDIGRALFGILDGMRKRKQQPAQDDVDEEEDEVEGERRSRPTIANSRPSKRLRVNETVAQDMIRKLDAKAITEETFKSHLLEAIETHNDSDDEGEGASLLKSRATVAKKTSLLKRKADPASRPLYLLPLYGLTDSQHDVHHPLFTFRPINLITPLKK